MKEIKIQGARQNNLKNINLNIPRNKMNIFTGVSGSGKSSLVFGTINAEAQRELMGTFSTFEQSKMRKYDKPDCDIIENLSLVILIEQKRIGGNSRSTFGTVSEIYTYLRLLFSRIGEPIIGMCNDCSGTGITSLTEMIYILDEPSVGLHPRDVHRLNEILINIRDKNNTVLVVEHDTDVIKIADNIIEMGYHAGSKGGNVVYEGSYEGLKSSDALTGKFLNRMVVKKDKARSYKDVFEIENATSNNLKNVSVKIPKNVFNCITGVAGSGKSSLIHNEFLNRYKDVVVVDQSPIGQSNRSNPATYCGAFDYIRKIFAKENSVSASLFSFNSKGACPVCKGQGYVDVEMAFLGSVKQTCDECGGKRYNKDLNIITKDTPYPMC